MKKITEKWVEFAKKDLKSAEILFNNKAYENSAWHCHQVLEKIFKAILAEKRKRVPKIHDLVDLLEETRIKLPEQLVKIVEELNSYYLITRYPDLAPQLKIIYSRKKINLLLKNTKQLFKWLITELNQLK